MSISAQDVKKLREETGAGIMDCKRALAECDGDFEEAAMSLRKKSQATAQKKSDRPTGEGQVIARVAGHYAVAIEIRCETDFVARSDDFQGFCNKVLECACQHKVADLEGLLTASTNEGNSTEEARKAFVAKVGENVQIAQLAVCTADQGSIFHYIHSGRIAVLVSLDQDKAELAHDIALHIAACNPAALNEGELDPAVIAQERSIYEAQAADLDKPEPIKAKIIEGKVRKFIAAITLEGQAFVKDQEVTVGQLAKKQGANILSFVRLQLGS